MTNHPEIQLQADDGTLQGNIYINGSGELVFREATNGNQLVLNNDGTLKAPANLRLSTGQSIEDGSGTARIGIASGGTIFKDETGRYGLTIQNGDYTRLPAYSGQPVQIRDEENGNVAVEYNSASSAPGTLELTNANLELPNKNELKLQDTFGNTHLKANSDGNDARLRNLTSGNSLKLGATTSGGNTKTYLTIDGSKPGVKISGGTLNLSGANLDASGQSVTTDKLNGADIQNANSGDVPVSDGDGTLSMKNVGGSIKNYKEFASDGTYNIPSDADIVNAIIISAGGGGGSGKDNSTWTIGGAGGGGGSVRFAKRPVGLIPNTSLDVQVGTGGSGGATNSHSSGNSNYGEDGGLSSVSYLGRVTGGTGGGAYASTGNAGNKGNNYGVGGSGAIGGDSGSGSQWSGYDSENIITGAGGTGGGGGAGLNIGGSDAGNGGGAGGLNTDGTGINDGPVGRTSTGSGEDSNTDFIGGGGAAAEYGSSGYKGGNGGLAAGGGGGSGGAEGYDHGAGGDGGDGIVCIWCL